ncbi:MAG: SulP family inorganic anion transporter [Methyloprofundus sp.]|nr:SulP family inorganic anion transporter [Methyloprofundus sp.]
MTHKHLNFYAQHLKQDIPAGIVVFLVALPLCLGIAMASGAPLFAGLIAGMIGGLVISWASGSQLSVSGPAAGLTVIVFNAIEQLGSYAGFLVAVVLAGILQLIFGYLRGGIIGAFFPSAVIKGMLAAIGLILIIKQIPHAVGYDVSFEGDDSYMMETATSSLQELIASFSSISIDSSLIAGVALLIIMIWETSFMKRFALVKLFPGALIAVMWGIGFNMLALDLFPDLAVTGKHLVTLPVTADIDQFIQLFQLPDFSFLSHPNIYLIALTLAIIASLETLLSLEAVDKIDPLKRIAPTNRELKAQGLGNIISGMIGGLPITSVIVRSSANINAGGQTRIASFIHGLLLVLSVMYLTTLLNLIPLACLAAILLQTGYKLAKPKLFINLYKQGWGQFLPFIITVIAILVTDLLQGIIIGIAVGLYFVIRAHYHASISLKEEDNHFTLTLHKDVSFLNKALLRKMLLQITENSTVTIDASQAQFIDHDIREIFQDFLTTAPDDNIFVEIIGLDY